jgi:4a-hydroxytetrahydrobiopterin dehydratase
MGDALTDLHCQRDVKPLGPEQIAEMLPRIHADWSLAEDSKAICRAFKFKNYYQTIAFVNALVWVTHSEDHHPDLQVSYNRCVVNYSTHSVGGLSLNDFICAAYIDALIGHDA